MNFEGWIDDDPASLTMEQALFIKEIKQRSTYRGLTLRCLGYESQWEGERLARTAAMKLLGWTLEELYRTEFDSNNPVHKDNEFKCFGGGEFWWL